jgi:hypothetical protein
MTEKKTGTVPCIVCNPGKADPGEYCESHSEELHRLEHKYESLFRLRRNVRGKDHEAYDLFFQGACDPSGRVVISETDPESLAITVLIFGDVDLTTPLADYRELGIDRTYGDHLRDRIHQEIVHSWYGNAHACVEVFRIVGSPVHWDLDARDAQGEEDASDPHSPQGGKHSIH